MSASAEAGEVEHPAPELALGMVLIGLVISSILYGFTIMQTYTYCRRFPSDHPLVKVLVAAVCLLDTLSVAVVTHVSWFYLVNRGSEYDSVWSLNLELVLSLMTSAISELFLAYRVWKVSGNHLILTGYIVFLALLHFGSGEASAIQFFILGRFSYDSDVEIPSIIRLVSGAICDTSIACSLTYFLKQKRNGYKRTDAIIDRLILYSINTGLLMSFTSVACLVTFILVPQSWVYLALCFLITRLYANTFLSTLNTRQILLATPTSNSDSTLPRLRSKRHRGGFISGFEEKSTKHIDVFVVTETISDLQRSASAPSSSSSNTTRAGSAGFNEYGFEPTASRNRMSA